MNSTRVTWSKVRHFFWIIHLLPMHLFSNPLKTLRFSDVIRGQRKGALGSNWLSNYNLKPTSTIKPKFDMVKP